MSDDDWTEGPANPLATAPRQDVALSAGVEMVKSRAAMTALARMAHARKFPRDEAAAFARIMTACSRPGLAESATYAYSKGGSRIEGPSIRLAEVLARCWGNLDADIYEVNRDNKESEMLAEVVDLETNTRFSVTFKVPHSIDLKGGKKKALDDDRGIYENNANMASRRLRACILRAIPGDVIDDALAQCEKTLRGESSEPLADRARKMVTAFGELGVSPAMIEAKLQHKLDAISLADLARLRKVYTAIKDGFGEISDHFAPAVPEAPAPAATLDEVADALVEKTTRKSGKKAEPPKDEFLAGLGDDPK